MQTHTHGIWWLRLATFSIAALAAASTAYWAFKWSSTRPSGPTTEIHQSAAAKIDPQAVARLLGAYPTVAGTKTADSSASPSQFKLMGVVASPSETGYALIAIGALPAKPYRVGEAVDESLMLQSVAPRSATLAATRTGPAAQILELPPLARP
jgi:general secretion pathway protein C